MLDIRTFSRNLKSLLYQKQLSQKQLAKAIGITEAAVSRYTAGARYPTIEILAELADFFDVTIDDLVGFESASLYERLPTDISILCQCYKTVSNEDRKVIWALLDRYLTPEQRLIINSIQKSANNAV